MELEIKRFDAPDETRAFDRGTFEVVEIGGMTVGRARYEPGWKWSEHVGAISGTAMCEVEHLGLVVSGRAAVAMNDGRELVMEPATCSRCRPATTVGSWATSRTCRCTSSARRTMPRPHD